MFYPPSSLDLSPGGPKPRPVYDNPPMIVRHRPLHAFVARLAAGRRTLQTCPQPRSESSF